MRSITKFIVVMFFFTSGLTACASAATPTQGTLTMTSVPNGAIESTVPLSEKFYAITNVGVVDVEHGIVVPDQTVIVVGDRIDQIGEQGKISAPQGAQTIDGHGLFLMPGLTDAHVHYYDAPIFGRVLIANGILLVRDMGTPNEYILTLRDELNRGDTLGPEMITTGTILDGDPPVIPSISVAVTTPEEGRAAVNTQANAGANMIKVYSRLDKETYLAIVDEAEKLGLKVVGHIPDSIYLLDAAQAGQKSSEHWFGFEKVIANLLGEPVEYSYSGMGSGVEYLLRFDEVDPQAWQDFSQQLKESGLTVVPTVVTYKNWPNVDTLEVTSLPEVEYVSQSLLSLWKSLWAGQTEIPDSIWQSWAKMVDELYKAGIPLMVGTDLSVPGIIPGYSVHEEMAIWQEAGIPAADILRSATLIPAQFMDLGGRLGSISVGKTASMVLVRANPLEDIKNAQQIHGVFLRGEYFDRQDLDRMLDEAKELAQQSTP